MALLRSSSFFVITAGLISVVFLHYVLIAALTHKYDPFSLAHHSLPSPPHALTTGVAHRASATFVMLCQNSDLAAVLTSMQQIEDRVNTRLHYPWTLLNNESFTEEFMSHVRVMTDAPVTFGVIPPEQWLQPEWINATRAQAVRKSMALSRVPLGGSIRHRNMFRFNSGFIFRNEFLQNYRYYWRIEPGSHYFCNIHYDPFLFMQEHRNTYGFVLAPHEVDETIPTLWEAAYDFMEENAEHITPKNMMKFLTDDGGDSYTRCHYESSFEITDMDFMRSEPYTKWFEYIDRKGGIFYERWGSGPILSIALSLFQQKEHIHLFDDIGYRHEDIQHCPQGDAYARGRCSCDPDDNFDTNDSSCLPRWNMLS